MSQIDIKILSPGECHVQHRPSGTNLTTDLPPEFGGQGRSFSATDLLAAALAVCIATNIDTVAQRHNIPFEAIKVSVVKELSQNPKRVSRLTVNIDIAMTITPEILLRLQRAANHCAVHHSLHPDTQVEILFTTL